jgi:hypothetical protein
MRTTTKSRQNESLALDTAETPIRGDSAVELAVCHKCIQAFCGNPHSKIGPWYVDTSALEHTGWSAADEMNEMRDKAIDEVVGRMEDSSWDDVALFYQGRCLAVIQYSVDGPQITKPEMQCHC